MKALENKWRDSIEFIASKQWLFLFLIPIFYISMRTPTPITEPLLLQAFANLLPAQVQQQLAPSEPEIAKGLRSSALALLLWTGFRLINRSNELSTEG
jgi:hypothetical protein